MPSFCAVVGCGSRGDRDSNSFFRIPAIPTRGPPHFVKLKTERRQKWIASLRRTDLTELKLKYAKICDKHFITGCPAELKDINHPDWVPSVLMGYKTKSKLASPMNRFLRNDELSRLREISLRRKATISSKIRSKHFTEGCLHTSKLDGSWLKSSAVPTILNFCNHNERKNKLERPTEDQGSRIPLYNPEENSNNSTSENTDSTGNVSPNEKQLKFSRIRNKISLIQRPNNYWCVAAADEFVIFSKWNNKYVPEKRVVIEHDLNVKVFIGDLEVNTFNLMELNSYYDVSDLLKKVDAINYSE